MPANDIERFINRKFAPEERAVALELVASATIHDGSPAELRLVRSALVASNGSIDRLRAEIAQLRVDYRDVIVSGEYVPIDGRLVRIRNLGEPIPDES